MEKGYSFADPLQIATVPADTHGVEDSPPHEADELFPLTPDATFAITAR